jgi:beta-glucanase (GH16 family)
MNKFPAVLVLLVLAVVYVPSPAKAEPPAGYHLVWSDDFSQDPDGLPDPAKWGYEEGFVRNEEAQYYTKARLENARVEHGQLIIEGRKEDYSPGEAKGAGKLPAHYTSASITTEGKASWLYGRIEVKAQLPAGKGVWPAIWTLGTDIHEVGWPRCGEIDIMEFVGKEPGTIYGTLHYFVDHKHASKQGRLAVEKTNTAFHVYAAEWTPDRIDLFVDGQKYSSLDVNTATNQGQNPFRKPQYLILNLALGGSWGGPIDDSIFPQCMTIAYVRVYQKSP